MNSLVYRIRQKMAPSKHHFDAKIDEADRKLDYLNSVISDDSSENNQFSALFDRIDMYNISQLKISRPNLSDRDAKIMLFRNLPAATGDMALYQSANSKLLHELDKICRDNNLHYWMWAGSAIAVEARGTAIPWDDDVDVCIMRDDLKKLISATKGNSSYGVTICYDYRAKNIQYRFVSRNRNILNFIDLVACDYATEYTPEGDAQYKALKRNIIHEFEVAPELEGWRRENFIYNEKDNVTLPQRSHRTSGSIDSNEAQAINTIYTKYHEISIKQGLLTNDQNKSNAIAYGLDGLFNFPKRQDIWDKSIIFPLVDKKYDDFSVMAACNNRTFCDICYSNWPYIPHLIKYGEHSLNQLDLHPEYRTALVEFVSQ